MFFYFCSFIYYDKTLNTFLVFTDEKVLITKTLYKSKTEAVKYLFRI